MSEIRFYHLTRKALEQVLPELLEKTLERNFKAVVMTGSKERTEALTQHLWLYNPNAFLPHGNEKDGNAQLQPIWLTSLDERPNEAEILFLTDGAQSDHMNDYTRVCEIFDGNDPTALSAARARWSTYRAAGHQLSYWQQSSTGWVNAQPQQQN